MQPFGRFFLKVKCIKFLPLSTIAGSAMLNLQQIFYTKGCMWDRQYLKVLRAVSMTKITKVIPEKARNLVERDHLKSSFFAKNLGKNTETNWKGTPLLCREGFLFLPCNN
jgi:hypothetical protein